MKTIKMLFTILICLLFTVQLHAGNTNDRHVSFKERTETWLQNSSESPSPRSDDGGGGRTDGETPEGDLSVGTPIHDALPLVFLLSAIYIIGCIFKSRTTLNKKRIIAKKTSLLVLAAFFSLSTTSAAAVYYVKEGGTGDGSSWANASGDIQAVIDAAQSLDKIFIAAGTYTPAADTYYDLKGKQLFIYGAFAGTETSTTPPAIPDTATYKTILQGNGERVFYSTCQSEITLQGLRIQGGVTTAASTGSGFGGGMNLNTANINYCTIIDNTAHSSGGGVYFIQGWIRNCIVSNNECLAADAGGGGVNGNILCGMANCIITNNKAANGGGAWGKFARGITNTTVSNNTCTLTGGGIYHKGIMSQNNITNCIIENNTAGNQAGGVYLTQQSTEYIKMIGCTVRGNSTTNANSSGGGVCTSGNTRIVIKECVIDGNSSVGNGGGVFLSTAVLVNSLVVNNTCSATGAGVRMEANSSGTYKSLLYNSTVANNSSTATQKGAGVSVRNAGCEIQNCIVWGNKNASGQNNLDLNGVGISAYSLFPEATAGDGNHNSNSDPLFADAANGNFLILPNSPALDAGSNTGITGVSGVDTDFWTLDVAGRARVVGAAIDMGAYEYAPGLITGVSPTAELQNKIRSSGKTLFVQSDEAAVLSVYTLSGALYFRQTVQGQTTVNNLPAGIYIAEYGKEKYKIVIQ
jgi:predicted outer membrane repeat protein